MANVGFKLGSQQALDNLLALGTNAKAVEGSFYLTSDTHRLYIGNADGSLSPVNQGVLSVAAIADLPAAATAEQTGGFYYVKAGNILCVATGGKWVQINAVKTIQSVTNSITTATNKAIVTTTVGVGTDADNVDTKNDTLTFQGAGSVHIAGSGKTVTVTGDKYAISAATNKTDEDVVDIKLTSDTAADSSSISLKAGDNVSLSADANGVVTIASSFEDIDTNTDTRLDSLTVIDNKNGATGFTLTAAIKQYDVVNNTPAVTLGSKTATIDPSIVIGVDEDSKETVKFVDGVASLNVYTKDELEGTLAALNAMTYKGTVGENGSAGVKPIIDENGVIIGIEDADGHPVVCAVGDAFLVAEDFKVGNTVISTKGSLLIAKGTEVAGIIVSDLAFDSVSSTSDTDTTYFVEAAANGANGIVIKERGVATTTKGSLIINGGTVENGASVSVAKDATSANGNVVLTVTHDTVDAPEETNATAVTYMPSQAAKTVTAVTGVTTDATGHLIGFETTEVKLGKVGVSESYKTAVTTAEDGTMTAAITPVTKVTSTGADGTVVPTSVDGTAFNLQSSSLTLSKPADGTVQVEMVWGSFE